MSKSKQKTIEGFEANQGRFMQASQPHESTEELNKAFSDFHEELSELRLKYRFSHMLVIYSANVKEKDGEIVVHSGYTGFGSMMEWLPMAAAVYGEIKATCDEAIRRMTTGTPNRKETR